MSPRFRPITPDSEQRKDDAISVDLDHLEAELAASIARLGRGAMADPASANDAGSCGPQSTFPPLDLPDGGPRKFAPAPAPSSVPPGRSLNVPPVSTAAPPASSGLDLLSELRLAAEQKTVSEDAQAAERQAQVERTERAMRMLLRYLTEFSRHLDRIRPSVPQSFRPLPNVELAGLHWIESFVDFRTLGGTETSPLDSVSLRYTLGTGDSICIEKLPNHAPAYLEELKRVGLRYTATERRSSRGMVAQVDFMVERSISAHLVFKADALRGIINVRARNFSGLGHAAYTAQVADVDQALLDEIGRHILGRPNQLFQRLAKDTAI